MSVGEADDLDNFFEYAVMNHDTMPFEYEADLN
jgi:hypothetical protein